jgi:hypothetical protein
MFSCFSKNTGVESLTMKKRMLFTLLIILPSLLIAGVTATYTTYPLHLESYNSIYVDTYEGTGTNHYQNLMAMHMGRCTIDTNGETIKNFALFSNVSNEFTFEGPTKNNPAVDVSIGFHAVAILRYGTQLYNSNLNQGYKNPINPTDTSMTGIITIDFYLISYEPATIFIENANYAHTSGTVGTFSVSYSDDSNFWNAEWEPVVDENNQPIPAKPYLESGTEIPQNDIPYGDPKFHSSFVILNNEEEFDISKAIGSNMADLATAKVTISNADTTKPCGVRLTFTNQTNTEHFLMKHENASVSQTIAYKLFFNGSIIDSGDSVDWDGLSNGLFTKDIKVTQIKKSDVDKLLEGTYRDTITVTLTPKDSV